MESTAPVFAPAAVSSGAWQKWINTCEAYIAIPFVRCSLSRFLDENTATKQSIPRSSGTRHLPRAVSKLVKYCPVSANREAPPALPDCFPEQSLSTRNLIDVVHRDIMTTEKHKTIPGSVRMAVWHMNVTYD